MADKKVQCARWNCLLLRGIKGNKVKGHCDWLIKFKEEVTGKIFFYFLRSTMNTMGNWVLLWRIQHNKEQ